MKPLALPLVCAIGFGAGPALATGFTDIGQDLQKHVSTAVEVDGYLRLRAELLHNLDLDRGPTPSGELFFPVPLSSRGQDLLYGDMRLRTDLAVYAPGGTLAVKARFDILDDEALGSDAQGIPAASSTSRPPPAALRVKRVYAETLTPFGLLAAGRMGAHWGLGMLTNGGDCADCDSGDAADRIAFVSPIAGHLWAIAFDATASGPVTARRDASRSIDIEPTDDVFSITFALLRYKDDLSRERRRKAGKWTLEYGAYASYRWQDNDVPAAYLPTARPVTLDGAQLVHRGYRAGAFDGWLRISGRAIRVEAEGAALVASVDEASLLPGVLLRDPVTSRQFGAVLESDVGAPEDRLGAGLDAGYASGDAAPGFGAFPRDGAPPPKRGDLDGPQASPPSDRTVQNFRFHPDYRIDRILFREIIGTVTDAVYLRPHARCRLAEAGPSTLSASIAGVASWAVEPTSTPSGKRPLGIEIDPTLAYAHRDGFGAALEYAALFPLSGLDNPDAHLTAKPAQLVRVRLMYVF